MSAKSGPRLHRAFLAAVALVFSLGLAGGVGTASAAQQVISSAGPLTNIYLNDNLGCQANHASDNDPEFFGGTDPGACGTFLSTGGTSYGPNVPAGGSPTEFTLVSQTAVTGSGTSVDPHKVVTVVDVASTGLQITQTDTYVVGNEFYRTDIKVANSTNSDIAAALYHAGDCYLQDSDDGYGFHDSSGGGIYCSAKPDNSPTDRIEGFVPLSSGSHYYEDAYGAVWGAIDAAGTQFPDTCDCSTLQDNGAGLSWALTVPANGNVTRSLLTAFSPTGLTPPSPPTFSSTNPASPGTDSTPNVIGSADVGVTSISLYTNASCTGTPVATGSLATFQSTGLTVSPALSPDGPYTFHGTATNGSGTSLCSTGPTGSITYVLDTTPPDTSITAGPANASTTNDSTPTFSFTSPDGTATFECRVDAAAFAACTTPFTTAALSDGSHTFDVRAKDPVGNVDASPASRTFTVNTSAGPPPPTFSSTNPASPGTDSTPNVIGSADVGVTSISLYTNASCTGTPVATGSLATFQSTGLTVSPALSPDGSYTFYGTATNGSGTSLCSTGPTGSITYVLDTTPPDTSITAGPANASTTNDPTPTFSFTSPDGTATFECRVDAEAFAACTTPFTTAALSDGSHTFDVRAKDPAGNVDASPASRTFTVDTTPPDTSITAGPANASTNDDPTPTFSFTSPDGTATFECRVDAAAFAACTTPFTTAALSGGSHTFDVRAKDPAGNVDASPASRTFTVNTAPPTGPNPPTSGSTTPASPGNSTPVTAQSINISKLAKLPSPRKCVSRRHFKIRLRSPNGDKLTKAIVFVNGKQTKVVEGTRLTSVVDLRGLPKGRFKVKIEVTTASGSKFAGNRKYRTCVPKSKSGKHKEKPRV